MSTIGKKYAAVIALIDYRDGTDFSKVNAALLTHGAAFTADNRSFKHLIDDERGILNLEVTSLTDFPNFKETVQTILTAAGLTPNNIEIQYSTPQQGQSR